MRRLTIGRWLSGALLGLTLVLAGVAGLGVAALYDARQRYEDDLARTYELEVALAQLGAAEAGALAVPASREAASRRAIERGGVAGRAVERAGARVRVLARRDSRGEPLLGDRLVAGGRVDAAAARAAARAGRRGARAARTELAGALAEVARLDRALAAHALARRAAARERARDDSRAALLRAGIADGLAVLAALALVMALVASLRRPLDELVAATHELAGGALGRRVAPDGPRELRELGDSFNSMGGQLARARTALEAERERLAVTIESMGDGLLACDAEGRVVAANPRAAELVPELAPGMRLDAEDPPLPELDEALRGEVLVERGERALAVTAALMGPEGEGGSVWTIRDVSERQRLERLKSEFVATASHELRSPLTSIKGFAELLAGSRSLAEREREQAEVIVLSTNRMVDLVNDLLDVASIEAGEVEVRRRPVDVTEVVREVATLLAPRLDDKAQELRLVLDEPMPRAFADPARLRQIVTNLATNAHLYTPAGGTITLGASAERRHVTLTVADTGRGMSPEELERVFDRFYRTGDGGVPGTGLGLSIVKSLVDLHGGFVDVESEPGRGTTFRVRLPRSQELEAGLDPGRAIRGKRVLIVDDEPAIAELIVTQLAGFEAEGVPVHDGAEAIQRLRSEHFDAVTLDVLMPGMSGFEVLRAIRADATLGQLPVVVVSVFSDRSALSGEWVVSKPIDAGELAYALGSAVTAQRTRVLVVGREELRDQLGSVLERMGLSHEWATTGVMAAALCREHRFEAALVDAGLRSPDAVVRSLRLRGRRMAHAVVVFSASDEVPGVARLEGDPVSFEAATAAVLHALEQEGESGQRGE